MRVKSISTIAVIVTAMACGGDSPTSPSEAGTLRVMLTDSPFTDAKAVLVSFSEVSAHKSTDEEFTKIPFAGAAPRTCDLKRLQSAQDVLGVGTLSAGQYTQIRLIVASATIYFDSASGGEPCAPTINSAGGGVSVDIPSGEIKLNRQFTVPEAGATTMLLDFDGDRSIRQTGNGRYMMSPVISIVSVQ